MSKKQTNKKKVTVKLTPGQAVYVADIDKLQHIMDLYASMADQCPDPTEKQAWMNIVEELQLSISETYFNPEDEDEEWY